ncbi:quinol:cytochrome C oxidoreductase [Botrimarina hoheduenensis]|uniref:Quinol:cytochrome C oxidoreductase n=1 Tax=Botrimarina hoheduenensis TaxID=2528000 RepID=A0A5C5W984_9BACT|nr:quinol:cytochrome C oxidoreductase [Botrimarina hoheduenensis]TWT46755.1 hypothetical protein Pla111_18560 [Botrimarina hoheduenensis]
MASLVNADITEIRQASAGLSGAAVPSMAGGLLLVGLAAGIGYATGDQSRFWHAYLLGVMYITTLGVGGLFFVIAHHLTGGRWGTTVRRLAEITAGTLTTSAVLFLPILALNFSGSDVLYPWIDRPMVEADPILASKQYYLEPTWFAIRTVVYFVAWIGMARILLSASVKQDDREPMKQARWMQTISGPMMILLALTMNFAAFDWMMSLEPHWFSTMFGVYFFAGSFLSFLAMLILLANYLQSKGVLNQSITTEHFHDLAKLMFAFIFFWGYIAFSQYMLIWYAAIPEETLWYDVRQQGPWIAWGLLLVFGHLLVPFLGTMSRWVRRTKPLIGFWAAWMMVMHWVDLVYIIQPQVRGASALPVPWLEAIATVGMLGIFIGAWMRGAAGKWLLPVQDPRLPIALSYHNH